MLKYRHNSSLNEYVMQNDNRKNWLSFTTINKNIICIKSNVNTQTIVNDKVFVHVVFSLSFSSAFATNNRYCKS